MIDEALRLDMGIAIFFLFLMLVGWIARLARRREELPDPDRSVKRGAQIADEMDRYSTRIRKQG